MLTDNGTSDFTDEIYQRAYARYFQSLIEGTRDFYEVRRLKRYVASIICHARKYQGFVDQQTPKGRDDGR